MARTQNKPFTKTELKILVYNKVKKGMSYEQAKREVQKEIDLCKDLHNSKIMKERAEKKDPNKKLKEDLKKQCKRKI